MIAAAVAATLLSTAQRHRIDSLVETVMGQRQIPALSIGVARGGARLYLRGYGARNERGEPADGFTIYAAGSIAKQFTAALVLQDVQRGALSLDAGSPSIRSLLSHTVRNQWQYDNANYGQLQGILERTDEVGYCALLTERILEPEALVSTSCRPPAARNVAANLAIVQRPVATGAAGLWSNAPDLLRWLEDLRTGRVVGAAILREMTTSVHLPSGVPVNYGFGFFTADWYGYAVAYHTGFVNGYSSIDALSTTDGLELAILTNAHDVDLVPLAKSVFAIADPPRDTNLYASPSAPAQNENARVSDALRAILESAAFESLGPLQLLEFLERSHRDSVTYDKYRATFASTIRIVTVGYGSNEAILSLTVGPAP